MAVGGDVEQRRVQRGMDAWQGGGAWQVTIVRDGQEITGNFRT